MRSILPGLMLALIGAAAAAPASAAPPQAIELRASEVTVRGGGDVIEASGNVRITDGRSAVRAGRAVYAIRARRIELSGGVAIASTEGNLGAERALLLLSADRRITSVEAAGGVRLQMRDRVLEAGRVSYTIGALVASASGDVRLSFPPDLAASGQQLTLRGSVARLTGEAKVETRDGFIQGDTMEFSETERVAYVRGHVRSAFADTRITADAATLYGQERKAVFRDNVTVTRPGRTMHASLVTVFYTEKRIVAEGETNIRIDEERRAP